METASSQLIVAREGIERRQSRFLRKIKLSVKPGFVYIQFADLKSVNNKTDEVGQNGQQVHHI